MAMSAIAELLLLHTVAGRRRGRVAQVVVGGRVHAVVAGRGVDRAATVRGGRRDRVQQVARLRVEGKRRIYLEYLVGARLISGECRRRVVFCRFVCRSFCVCSKRTY